MARNPDYWKKGFPYLDAIEWRIITSRSTRVLAFVAGEFDMTFVADITVPLMKDVMAQAPTASCHLVPTNVPVNVLVNRDLNRSFARLRAILTAERLKRVQKPDIERFVNGLLSDLRKIDR